MGASHVNPPCYSHPIVKRSRRPDVVLSVSFVVCCLLLGVVCSVIISLCSHDQLVKETSWSFPLLWRNYNNKTEKLVVMMILVTKRKMTNKLVIKKLKNNKIQN